MTSGTIDAARGRWREILPALGVGTGLLNGKHQACPICRQGTDRFRFTDRSGDGDFFCNQCGAGKGLQFLTRLNGWDFKRACDEVDRIVGTLPATARSFARRRNDAARQQHVIEALWAEAQPIEDGDPIARYLSNRALRGPYSNRLRFHPKCFHRPTESHHPAMLALFEGAGDDRSISLHRTFLDGIGGKLDHKQVRMFMPGRLPKGGAVRLGKASELLGIAEGIETAMSAARWLQMPVWAACNAGNLEKWQPPELVRHVVIFGDNDRETFVGQAAAYALAKRLAGEDHNTSRKIEVRFPSHFKDWNDFLRGQHA